MKKLAPAVVFSALVILASLGTAQAQEKYQDVVGTWLVNIDACRPCVMEISSVDKRGNLVGTHTSLNEGTVPLVGKVVTDKNGDVWLRVQAPFGQVNIEVALCEDQAGGYYTVGLPTKQHFQVTYKKVA